MNKFKKSFHKHFSTFRSKLTAAFILTSMTWQIVGGDKGGRSGMQCGRNNEDEKFNSP